MIRSLFFCLVVILLSLAALAAGDQDDYKCPEYAVSLDASLKKNLTSPLYGKGQYPPNLLCSYQINAPDGHKVKLTFKDFDVDPSNNCVQDKLLVHWNGQILHFLCGQELPRPIVSTDKSIIIQFMTDFIQGGRGFVIEYESGPNMQICEPGYALCRNRNCYNLQKECDSVDDCGDGTDEEDCGHRPVTPSDCGIQEISPRMNQDSERQVGGEEAIPNSWPWQVSLQDRILEPNGHFCGGTLINTLWVLTAAHCIFGNPSPAGGKIAGERLPIKIVLGSHGKFTSTSYQQVRYSAKVISYREHLGDISSFDMENDITLIKLNAPVQLNAGVHPICLPNFKIVAGWKCYSTGWGITKGTGSSDALKQTVLYAQSQEECSHKETQLCFGNKKQSPCSGDSGGPVQCLLENKWYVMGAASFVSSNNLNGQALCVGPDAKAVFASTVAKLDWIKEIISKY